MLIEVAVEGVHLGIDIPADPAHKITRHNWELRKDAYPSEVLVAMATQRDAMSLPDRLAWAMASNEIIIGPTQIAQLAAKLDQVCSLCRLLSKLQHFLTDALADILADRSSGYFRIAALIWFIRGDRSQDNYSLL